MTESIEHASDCAVHNEPAMPAGACDCRTMTTTEQRERVVAAAKKATPGDWVIRPEPPNEGQHRRLISANIKADGSPNDGETLNGGIYVVETKGRDALANALFVSAANPAFVLSLVADLEEAEAESRRRGVKIIEMVEHAGAHLCRAEAAEQALSAQQQENERLREAAQDVINQRFSTYRGRGGREIGVQDDNGEKVWLVPHDPLYALEAALQAPHSQGGEGNG